MQRKLKPAFTFAGITFPKYVWTLPRGTFTTRIERMRNPVCGDYYHEPKPVKAGDHGVGFYLDSDGMPGLRWKWCDDVEGVRIDHTGWFCDEYQDGKIRGVVFRLPRSRGFLAGWAMGEGMVGALDCYIYADEEDAARAADSMAEREAEESREDFAKGQAEGDIIAARSNIHEINRKALALIREIKKAGSFTPAVCSALREKLADYMAERASQFRIIDAREASFWSAVEN